MEQKISCLEVLCGKPDILEIKKGNVRWQVSVSNK